MSDNVKVVIKIRPLIDREKNASAAVYWATNDGKEIHSTKLVSHSFLYDRVFEADGTNMQVYQETAKPIVRSAMLGFNGTIFAYGQTSSGKTYTIMGKPDSWGVIPLSIEEIFETIENTPNRIFLLRISYMEIYNENVTDLLSGQSKLKIHENQNGDVFVGDLAEEIVRDPETIYALLQKGEARRHVGETNMNDKSSRSHTIFRIIIESREFNNGDIENTAPEASDSCDNIVTVSHLNIVDLAGSERAAQTGATGDRLKEGCAINKSLFTLAQVISKLSDNAGQIGQNSNSVAGSSSDNPQFVNFRDSKLTRILQNSLGGNSKTAIICTITPASLDETLSTLKFANRAKDIKNKPIKNEVGSDEAMLRRCQKQINELKKQINDLSGSSNIQALQIEKDNLAKQLTEKEEKISQLMHLICISSKIVLSPVQKDNRDVMKNRRITWCPGVNKKLMAFSPFPINSKRYKPEVPPVTEVPESSFVAVDRDCLIRDFDLLEKGRVSFTDSVNDRRKFCDADCQTEENASVCASFEAAQKSLTSEIGKLQEEKKLLFHQYKSLISKFKNQNADVVALKSDLESIKKLNQELEEENRRLLDKKDESRIFYQDELESLSASRDQCQKLTEENAKKDEQLEKMNEELQEANRQFEQLLTENWTINQKVRKLTHENLQKENLLQEKNVVLENLLAENDKTKANENNVEENGRQLNELVEQVERKTQILHEQEDEIKILRIELDRLKNSRNFAEENKELLTKLEEKGKVLRNYEEEISSLKDALPRLEHQLIEKDEILGDNRREIETLRADLTKLKIYEKMLEENSKKFESYINELVQQNEKNRETLNDYEREIDNLRQQVELKENFGEEYEKLKAKLGEKEETLRNNEDEISKLGRALSQLQHQLIQKDEVVNGNKREFEELRGDLDKMKSDEKMHEENNRELERRVNELVQENKEHRETLNLYESEIASLRQQIDSKETLDGRNDELTTKLGEKEDSLRNYEQEISKLKDGLSQLEHQLTEKDEMLDNYKGEIEALRCDLDKVKIDEQLHEETGRKFETRVNELIQQNEENRRKANDYEHEIGILRQQINSKESLDEKNNELATKLAEAEKNLRIHEEEITNLRDSLPHLENQLAEKVEILNNNNYVIEKLRSDLDKMKSHEENIRKLESRIDELIQKNEDDRLKLDAYEREVDALRQQINSEENIDQENKRLIERLTAANSVLNDKEREITNLRIELAQSEVYKSKDEDLQKFECRIDELLRQNDEKECILSDYKLQVEALRTELNSLKQNERSKEEKFKRHLDELIDQNNQKENTANNFKREIEILRQKLNILHQSRRLDELQKETKQKSKMETQQQDIDTLRRILNEKKSLEKEQQRKIEELEAQISKQSIFPPAGSLCRGGIIEEHNIHMLDRKLYIMTKKMERLEKQLEVVTCQRDEAVIKLAEFELSQNGKEKLTVGRSSLDCTSETDRLSSKTANSLDVKQSNDENVPIPPPAKDQTFTLPRKSVLESIENASPMNKSTQQEMREKCKQQ